MNIRTLLAAVVVAAAAGCGGDPPPLPMATTPEQARPALDAALSAWKAGKTTADLKAQSPPVYFNDDDFVRGRTLVDYAVADGGRTVSTGMSYSVTLTLKDGEKPPATRKLAYRVVTTPNVSISREDK